MMNGSLQIYFNSSMVRLRDPIAEKLFRKVIQFQFQYGAIKSWNNLLTIIKNNNFNSSMVRLRV